MRALDIAASGMAAQDLNVQVISNNIANMNTTGYKRQRAQFQDLLYEHVSRVGTQTSAQGNILPVGIDLVLTAPPRATPTGRILPCTQTSAQGNILPVGIDLGGGVKTVGTPRLMTQGTMSQTGNNLNVAIRGDGFLKIQLPDGTFAYTRDGSLQMDAQGRIVTAQG